MQNDQAKIKQLIAYCQGIYHKENGKVLYEKYLEAILSITPQELVMVQQAQLEMGYTPKQLISVVDKLINVFNKSLSAFQWKRPEPDTFLYDLIAENQGIVELLDQFKTVLKENEIIQILPELKTFVQQTYLYNAHLLKLENIVFPYMGNKAKHFDGLKIMKLLHDELRMLWNELMPLLTKNRASLDSLDLKIIGTNIGKLYFLLYGLVQKQELILFPAMSQLLSESELADFRELSLEYPLLFIKREDRID